MKFYAIQPEFYIFLRQHEQILNSIDTLDEKQKDLILCKIKAIDLKASMEIFYQISVDVKGNSMMYVDDFQQMTHAIEISCYTVSFTTLNNPFFDILKRLYRCWILVNE